MLKCGWRDQEEARVVERGTTHARCGRRQCSSSLPNGLHRNRVASNNNALHDQAAQECSHATTHTCIRVVVAVVVDNQPARESVASASSLSVPAASA